MAQTVLKTPPQSILWVGNSFFYYNNSLHGHVANLARAGNKSIRGVSLTISGSGLDWHDMASYLRPDGIGRYSFVGDNEIRFNQAGRQFDAAIMMDCSQCPIHEKLGPIFHETVKKHSATLRASGVEPILFMSWAYKDKPEMTEQLAEQYVKAGKDNNALVLPVGLAFAKAIAGDKSLELYVPDKRHPSLAGTYLAACVVYASLFKQSPEGLNYSAGLDSVTVKQLQSAAWETVKNFYNLK